MIVKSRTGMDAEGTWWGAVETKDNTHYFEEGFRTRKDAHAAMVRYMIELRNALDAAIAKEKK